MRGAIHPLSHVFFMARRLFKHSDDFTFYFITFSASPLKNPEEGKEGGGDKVRLR
jgi:hypothetical protein